MKKCIVLDLDNTLWGGIVGEDGPQGITLSLAAPGAYFVAFQQALLDLHNRGVILAINSANNPADALEAIRSNPNMILKEQHFAAMRINWEDKVENMRSLAAELNIGLDAMVFMDDSAHNRAAMRGALPEVETPELPQDPAEYARFLHALPYFASAAITDEDKMRGNMYVTERLRKEAEKAYPDRQSFLAGLGLTMEFKENDESSSMRIAQLTEKTNQFNTRKIPFTNDELLAYMHEPAHRVYSARVTDRFGDHGLIAVALVRSAPETWTIESLLMSCRVIGRGIEDAFISKIAERAADAGAETLRVTFEPTAKNIPAREFVERYFAGGAIPTGSAQAPSWIHYA
jgi:FkbH-like protein